MRVYSDWEDPPDYDAELTEYPHSASNLTCPGAGLKCLCEDIDEYLAESEFYVQGGES